MMDEALLKEEFETLLSERLSEEHIPSEGSVVKGRVVAVENDQVIIDIGFKMEGRIELREFSEDGKKPVVETGDVIDIYLERYENLQGESVLSREKARREEAWKRLEVAHAAGERVEGVITSRVKGGFTVDLGSATAFLPGSQVDIRPVRDLSGLLNILQKFQILKMDKRRGNVVVSRRAVMEESRAEQRVGIINDLKEGEVIEGVVKNITDYGAFVDLGGIDGLLHVTDMAWNRVNHPTEVIHVGQSVRVTVIKMNKEMQRISLGMKQLTADPWQDVDKRYFVGERFSGRVTNVTDYGAFIELEPGIEGLVHVSEMSWTKKNVHPGKIVSTSQEVEVIVLDVDPQKRRISLGIKQCFESPWKNFSDTHKIGDIIEGEIRNIADFGLFVGLDKDIDGMVHLSDLSWNTPTDVAIQEYKKGDMVRAIILDIDIEKERVSLGVKQIEGDPFEEAINKIKRGAVVTCSIVSTEENGIEVEIHGLKTFIRRVDLSRDRSEQRPERFSLGDKIDAKVTNIDRSARKISLSIKSLEIAEEKEAVAQYGSSSSGASLGDILGLALNNKKDEEENDDSEKE
jgi:small subunit ribosomal protein S1